MHRFQRSILNLKIKITIWKLKVLCKKLEDIRNYIYSSIPYNMYQNFSRTCRNNFEILFNRIRTTNIRRLQSLISNFSRAVLVSELQPNFIYNHTDMTVPQNVGSILSLCPKFSIPLSNFIPIPTIIKDFEVAIQSFHLDEENKNLLRTRGTNIITNYWYKSQHRKNKNPLLKSFINTKMFIKNIQM